MKTPVHKRIAIRVLVGMVVLIATVKPVCAQPAFGVAPSTRFGRPGDELAFTGAVTNSGSTDFFLNEVAFSFSGPALTNLAGGSNTFFANVPGILSASETYTGAVFTVVINPSAPPGDYSGSVTLLGGADIFATNQSVTAGFQVTVLPGAVPTLRIEKSPGAFLLSWAATNATYSLQENSSPADTNGWGGVSGATNLVNQTNIVSLPDASGQKFFRLKYP
jgi:hypothetical protein